MRNKEQEIQELREEIEEIKASLPAHSVQAASLIRLEELEERLAELEGGGEDAPA
jgi:TolA-binding protein